MEQFRGTPSPTNHIEKLASSLTGVLKEQDHLNTTIQEIGH